MNDPYHWHAELMVKHEMQEVDRAVEQARLLREAGLSRRSLLARAIDILRSLLVARKKSIPDHHSETPRTYRPANDKLSQ